MILETVEQEPMFASDVSTSPTRHEQIPSSTLKFNAC